MWELDYKESWALKNWCFWTVVLGRHLRVPWTARRSNQSILKEISSDCSLEGLMLKLKLQYLATWCEELTHLKRPWCWERLKAGGDGDDRGWDDWMASLTQRACVWLNSRSCRWTRRPVPLWHAAVHGVAKSRTRPSDWTELRWFTGILQRTESPAGTKAQIWNGLFHHKHSMMPSLVAQMVENLPAIWETWVCSLCWEDLLGKRMAMHSSIPA